MAIRSRASNSVNTFDALTISSEIPVLGGNTRQMYSAVFGTFEDDRKWVPCILGGYVFVVDPANVMNGEATLADIEWYTQTPIENDYATGRITNPGAEVLNDVDVIDPDTGAVTHEAAWRSVDFLISDGSNSPWCSNVPAHCLIIHKNMPSETSMTLYAVLKFIDKRTGLTVRRLETKDIGTSGFNDEATVLRGPSGGELLIDAMAIPDTVPAGQTVLDIAWMRSISVQMVGAEGDVPDAKACYLWTKEDTTTTLGYRPFTDDEILALNLQGVQTKTLTYDARMITTETLRMRCYACRRDEDDAWSTPLDADNPFYDYRVTAELNNKVTGDPVQKLGFVQDIGMTKQVKYSMDLRYNGHPMQNAKMCLFLIHWFSTGRVNIDGSYVYVKNDMGYGPDIAFRPCDYGYTYADGYKVDALIETYAGCVPVKDGNSFVTSENRLVISPKYE